MDSIDLRRSVTLSKLSILASIFLSSCLGSKFLRDNQQLLVANEITGVSGGLKDEAGGFLQQEPNSRLGIGGIVSMPFTHLAHLYQLGANGFERGLDSKIERKKWNRVIRISRNKGTAGITNRINSKVERKSEVSLKISSIKKELEVLPVNSKKYKKKYKKLRRIESKVTGGGFNPEKVQAQRDSIEAKFLRKIDKAKTPEKKQRLRKHMLKKLDKKDRKLREGNQLMRWGEPLAIYEHDKSIASAESIKLYLNSKGYFNSSVFVDTAVVNEKRRQVQATYKIELNNHYYIDSIEYQIEDSVLEELVYQNLADAPLKKGFYDQETLTKQRDFLYNLAVNNGYFEFSKQYISFQIDSTALGSDTLYVREIIRNPENRRAHKIFYLDSIVFISNASISQSFRRTVETYKDITFSFGKNRYSKKILQWRIPLEQDDRYSRALTIETQRQLSYLDNFKFVNINYDTTGRQFVANIFTSPFDKYQTSSEFGIIQNTTSSQVPSPFVNVSLKNRNTFRSMETINLDFNARLEGINGVTGGEITYSSQLFSGDLSFLFPQFLFPLGRYYKEKMGLYNPRTRLTVGAAYDTRTNEYTRRSISTSLAYSWQVRDQLRHTFTPIQLSLIDSDIKPDFQKFLDDLEEGNTYALSFRSAYVNSSSYRLDRTIGAYGEGKDGGFIRSFVEFGGHFNDLFGQTIFGNDSLERFQYLKANIDLRKIEKVKRKLNIAYRLNIGMAVPYSDNNALPYEKYFFAGGSNSVRAWRPRRLGPGAFGIPVQNIDSIPDGARWTEIDYTLEQRGELLIESSFEVRQKLVGLLEGSIFLDAGNIWLIRGSTVNRDLDPDKDDGKFRWRDFMDEMALGTGIGLRFDLSFLILRLDLGLKLVDPAQAKGKRFVGDEIFRNFGPNSEVNIGIGYSF